jgi:hypothetical protein
MGYWCSISDRRNLEAGCGKRPNGGFPTGAWTFHVNVDATEAEVVCFFRSSRRGNLCSVGSILTASLESHFPRAGPGDRIPVLVGERYDHIVERRLDMGLPVCLDDHILFTDGACWTPTFLSFSHSRCLSACVQLRLISSVLSSFRRPFSGVPCACVRWSWSVARGPAGRDGDEARGSYRYP